MARYLLSPLALAMVAQEGPGGDQFLFVRSDGQRIQVEFVDPDGPEPKPGELGSASGAASAREVSASQRRAREGEPGPAGSPPLPALLLAPRGRRRAAARKHRRAPAGQVEPGGGAAARVRSGRGGGPPGGGGSEKGEGG